jgi:RNA polymerase sigma-70 factor (ECF subfamily)
MGRPVPTPARQIGREDESGQPPPEAADEVLLARFQSGDARAFEVLLARHRRTIFHFILRWVGDKETAEDLLQDVFLRVVASSREFKGESKFTTWLYTIARNLCIDTGRKRAFRRHASLDAPAGRGSDPGEGPALVERIPGDEADVHRQALRDEVRPRIEAALETLVEEQREVFILRELSNLPFKEIAEIVGTSENTVKSRMRYALEKLRAALAEYEDVAKALR